MKIVRLSVMLAVAGWITSASFGQQATNPVDTPAAEQGQTANDQQDSQLGQSLGTQQGTLDQQQAQQLEPPGLDDQLDRQREFEQMRQQQQQRTLQQPGQLDTRGMQEPETARRPGFEGAGEPGVLGVMIVESAGPGVRIQEVVGGTAAAEVGLAPGDVILEINGQGVSTPPEVTQMIRAIPAGQVATLTVWRNGAEQEIAATLQGARQRYQSNYRGSDGSSLGGDAAGRIARLESQLAMVMRELRQLRQEVMQLRTAQAGRPDGATGFDGQLRTPDATQPGLEQPSATEPGLEQPPATQPELEEPATEPGLDDPATEPGADDLFSEPETTNENPALPF